MNFTAEAVVDTDHPSLAGHFPGNPIVPGVVVLQQVAAVAALWRSGARVQGFPSVKFLRPLLPGQPFSVTLTQARAHIAFRCAVGANVFAAGTLDLYPDGSDDC